MSQIKKFYKTDPPKVEIMIQNTISKFSKPKNQTKKNLKESLRICAERVGKPL